jgi:hypothetical protein
MPRLRRVDCAVPAISRRRRGRGFEYLNESGERIEDPDRSRTDPRARRPAGMGAGLDLRRSTRAHSGHRRGRQGRKYRYHDLWRERRDRQKFDAIVDFARSLPTLRERVERDLRRRLISRERCSPAPSGSSTAALPDRLGGLRRGERDLRAGDDAEAPRHGQGRKVVFEYEAKGGKRRVQVVGDRAIAGLVGTLRQRRGGGYELLAYRDLRAWRDVPSVEINET